MDGQKQEKGYYIQSVGLKGHLRRKPVQVDLLYGTPRNEITPGYGWNEPVFGALFPAERVIQVIIDRREEDEDNYVWLRRYDNPPYLVRHVEKGPALYESMSHSLRELFSDRIPEWLKKRREYSKDLETAYKIAIAQGTIEPADYDYSPIPAPLVKVGGLDELFEKIPSTFLEPFPKYTSKSLAEAEERLQSLTTPEKWAAFKEDIKDVLKKPTLWDDLIFAKRLFTRNFKTVI
jgi:hypothetical protein